MSELSLTGKIISILKLENATSKAGKEWKKRDFVIETDDKFPKKVCLCLFGDKTDYIEGHAIGDTVTVKFNVESREYNGKWYHNLNVYQLSGEKSVTVTEEPEKDSPSDDLPF